jgi:hypothetical protein
MESFFMDVVGVEPVCGKSASLRTVDDTPMSLRRAHARFAHRHETAMARG